MPVYMKTRFTTTVSRTIVNEDAPLPCAPPAAAPAPRAPPAAAPAPRAPPAAVQNEEILWASIITFESIMDWLPNTTDTDSWIHPVRNEQYKNLRDGQLMDFKVIGDFDRDCKVVVIEKLPFDEYDLLKKTKTVGAFSAEAKFPWNKYKECKTCLIRVKRV